MSIPGRTMRGLQEIRSRLMSISGSVPPSQSYTRIAFLELERCRRVRERMNALQQIRTIDKRVSEIEAEKTAILSNLNGQKTEGAGESSCGDPPRSKGGSRSQVLKIRY
jgi:hypothetical protein